MVDWWRKRFIWLTWGDYGDFSQESIERVVEEASRRNCNLLEVVSYKGDINREFALYDSEVLPKWDGARGRDLLREQVEAAHRKGLRTRTYLNVHYYGDEFYSKQKDWAQVKSDGKPIDTLYGHGFSMCVNTPYRDRMFKLILEIAERGVDVIFLDGPAYYPGACYCKHCRSMFEQEHGFPIPVREDWRDPAWRSFVIFRYNSIARFLKDGQRKLREKGFETLLYSNNSGQVWPSWSFALSAEDSYEGQSIIGMESYQYYTLPNSVPVWFQGWTTKLANSIKREKPFCLFLAASHQPWFRQRIPDVEYLLGKVQGLANGADMFEDHGFAREAIEEGKRFFDTARKYETYYQEAESDAKVALVWSRRTGDFFFEIPPQAGAEEAQARVEMEKPATIGVQAGDFLEAQRIAAWKFESEKKTVEEARGFYEALLRLHVPFDLISDLNVNSEDLKKYSLVILPNVACMSSRQVEAVRSFVESGGGLVATYKTSMFDETGYPRDPPALSDVFGVSVGDKVMGPLRWDYMVIKKDHALVAGVPQFKTTPEGLRILPSPEFVIQTTVSQGLPVCLQLEPASARYGDLTPETGFPTIVASEFGRGRAVYFPCTFAGQYWNNGFLDYLKIIENSVKWAGGRVCDFETDAPETVEITVFRGRNYRMIHLVNFTYALRRPFNRVFPVENISFKIRSEEEPRTVKALTLEKSLEWSFGEGFLRFVLPKLGLYEALLIEY
ncbi:MAG: beta-galactosidase trimerization domain-containing protein [Thermoproteota archaeon]